MRCGRAKRAVAIAEGDGNDAGARRADREVHIAVAVEIPRDDSRRAVESQEGDHGIEASVPIANEQPDPAAAAGGSAISNDEILMVVTVEIGGCDIPRLVGTADGPQIRGATRKGAGAIADPHDDTCAA